MSALHAAQAIVTRDLSRAFRQKGRLWGGLARSFMWLLLVAPGYGTIARVEGAPSYQAFVFPGIVVMAALFGAMLTAISTVYDREFGMLRLMLASPAGLTAVLAGRAVAASAVGILHGGIVLISAPLFIMVTGSQVANAAAILVAAAAVSSVLGLARRRTAPVGRELRCGRECSALSTSVPERRTVSHSQHAGLVAGGRSTESDYVCRRSDAWCPRTASRIQRLALDSGARAGDRVGLRNGGVTV